MIQCQRLNSFNNIGHFFGHHNDRCIQITTRNLGTGDVLDGTDGFVVDIIPPTLAITTDDLALATGETANITFTFSEAVTGFDVSDIAVVGG
ncbi:Ig-like domain-containing protein, partial [Acinetobacter baumannii]|uniref:Ig-like domain-containing protein n=1 Tax=Acinetobacter baumannii TaxID=470 RepID=UPI003ED93C0A